MKRNKYGFTLVELLAVIVILAIILVIAVPKVMSVIEDSKKATLESTVKMIASSAEKAKVQNTVLGKVETITCDSVAKINKLDYEDCKVDFEDNTAKVTIKGSGKFAGLYVCSGDKTEATATTESCMPVVNAVDFETDDWSTIVAAVQQAVTNGTEYPYNVGDEKTVEMDADGNGTAEEYTIRVANKTKCSEVEVEVASETACGFVLEFADVITGHAMNGTHESSSTNAGGWPATEMRAYLNDIDLSVDTDGVIYNALPEELRAGIINTYVVSSHGDGDTTGELENDNFGSTDKLYLLSTYEVWGSNPGGYDTAAIDTITRQLDYYANYKGVDSSGTEYIGVSTTNKAGAIKYNSSGSASYWWLRSARSSNSYSFYNVKASGDWNYSDSYGSGGVSPAFRLAE